MITVICIVSENQDHPFDSSNSYFSALIVLLVYSVLTFTLNFSTFRAYTDPTRERQVTLATNIARLVLMIAVLILMLVARATYVMYGFLLIVNLIFCALSTLLSLLKHVWLYIQPQKEEQQKLEPRQFESSNQLTVKPIDFRDKIIPRQAESSNVLLNPKVSDFGFSFRLPPIAPQVVE